jgi:hypothetical protein
MKNIPFSEVEIGHRFWFDIFRFDKASDTQGLLVASDGQLTDFKPETEVRIEETEEALARQEAVIQEVTNKLIEEGAVFLLLGQLRGSGSVSRSWRLAAGSEGFKSFVELMAVLCIMVGTLWKGRVKLMLVDTGTGRTIIQSGFGPAKNESRIIKPGE